MLHKFVHVLHIFDINLTYLCKNVYKMAGDAEILLNMLPTALDNFLAEDIKHLKSLDYEDFVDPSPDSVDATFQFLEVR